MVRIPSRLAALCRLRDSQTSGRAGLAVSHDASSILIDDERAFALGKHAFSRFQAPQRAPHDDGIQRLAVEHHGFFYLEHGNAPLVRLRRQAIDVGDLVQAANRAGMPFRCRDGREIRIGESVLPVAARLEGPDGLALAIEQFHGKAPYRALAHVKGLAPLPAP